MSFYNEGQDFRSPNKSVKLMSILLLLAVGLGGILVLWQVVRAVVNWWQLPNNVKFPRITRQANLSEDNFLNFNDQFSSLLVKPPLLRGENEEEVYLNIDHSLLISATQAAELKKWYLELNVDGDWNEIFNAPVWGSLVEARPQMWRYLLVYQADAETVAGYSLNVLDSIEILTLSKAVEMLIAGETYTFSIPPDRLELLGVIDDQLYVYVSNQLDEGVIMLADYGEEFNSWQVWPGIKGKLAYANGQSFLLEGFSEGCSSVNTFKKIDGKEKKLERLVTTYNGCVAGDRFLGVDQQGRILLAEAQNDSSNKSANLDLRGKYVDLYAVPIKSAGDRTRLLFNTTMPSDIHHVAFFPGTEMIEDSVAALSAASADGGGERLNLSVEVNNNGYREERVEVVNEGELSAGTSASDSGEMVAGQLQYVGDPEGWRRHDQIVMLNQNAVWLVDLLTGEVKQVANLMNLFGKPIIRSWQRETLCLEMADRPDLSVQDRMISIDLETGVPIAGTEVCLRHTVTDRPYVNNGASRNDQEARLASQLLLPEDFRLIRRDEKIQEETELTEN